MTSRRMAPQVRRATQWFSTNQAFLSLAAGAITNVTLFGAGIQGARFIKGSTVTRMIVNIDYRADAVSQDNRVFWGIAVVNADARAANVFPQPADMSDRAGWLVRGRENVMANSRFDVTQFSRVRLDLRSQRVLRNEEEELQLIYENNGTNLFSTSVFIRLLIKWPL